MARESLTYHKQIKWFTSLIGKKTTFEFIKTYIREMLDTDDLDVIIATGEVTEGKTKRWIIAWKFLSVDDSLIN